MSLIQTLIKWKGLYSVLVSLGWVCVSHTQVCPTLWNPMDCSPPGSSVQAIFQTRILEWIAIPFSKRSSWPRDQTWVSCFVGRLFTIWATRGCYYINIVEGRAETGRSGVWWEPASWFADGGLSAESSHGRELIESKLSCLFLKWH